MVSPSRECVKAQWLTVLADLRKVIMPPSPAPRPFYRDSRGNRLESWTVVIQEGGHFLWLRGATEMLDQIKQVGPEYQDAQMQPSASIEWTHVLYSHQHVRPEVTALLKLLERVITLPVLENMTGAIALDWYKIPPDAVDSHWRNTTSGDLVYRGKYWYKSDAEQQAIAGRTLARFACEAVLAHANMMCAAVVLDVPGHDSKQVSFGSRLAATVARDTSKLFVKVAARSKFRAETKAMNAAQQAESLRDQFEVRESLVGASVLIVDDVFRSGASMEEVARAARVAGALSVYGLAAVRTMRK